MQSKAQTKAKTPAKPIVKPSDLIADLNGGDAGANGVHDTKKPKANGANTKEKKEPSGVYGDIEVDEVSSEDENGEKPKRKHVDIKNTEAFKFYYTEENNTSAPLEIEDYYGMNSTQVNSHYSHSAIPNDHLEKMVRSVAADVVSKNPENFPNLNAPIADTDGRMKKAPEPIKFTAAALGALHAACEDEIVRVMRIADAARQMSRHKELSLGHLRFAANLSLIANSTTPNYNFHDETRGFLIVNKNEKKRRLDLKTKKTRAKEMKEMNMGAYMKKHGVKILEEEAIYKKESNSYGTHTEERTEAPAKDPTFVVDSDEWDNDGSGEESDEDFHLFVKKEPKRRVFVKKEDPSKEEPTKKKNVRFDGGGSLATKTKKQTKPLKSNTNAKKSNGPVAGKKRKQEDDHGTSPSPNKKRKTAAGAEFVKVKTEPKQQERERESEEEKSSSDEEDEKEEEKSSIDEEDEKEEEQGSGEDESEEKQGSEADD